MQRLHDAGRQPLRPDQPIGAVRDRVDAALLERWRIGILGNTLLGRHGQDAELPAVDLWRPLRGIGQKIDMPAQQRRHPFGAALVGHMRKFRAGHLIDLDHHQIAAAAHPTGAIGVFLGVFLAGGNQILDGLPGRLGPHHDPQGVGRQTSDVGEVAQRVPRHRLIVRITQAVDAHDRELIAVGFRVEQLGWGERAGSTRLDIDQDRLPECLADFFGQKAQMNVSRATRGERVVDRDRTLGLPLCLPDRTHRQTHCCGSAQHQRPA